MTIYVNGKYTSYENIFDLLEAKNISRWYGASTELIGRDPNQVLDDWANTHKTYYYIERKRYNFELK